MIAATARACAGRDRTRRLKELVLLAAAFNGWSLRQLADALERDPSKLVPDSGAPKVDLIMRLAESLGWNVDDLLSHLHAPVRAAQTDDDSTDDAPGADPDPIDPDAASAAKALDELVGRCDGTTLARRDELPGQAPALAPALAPAPAPATASATDAFDAAASSPSRERDEFRIRALHAAALKKLDRGRHAEAIEAFRAALAASTSLESPHDRAYRADLLLGLADAHHRLGEAIEGRAIASEALAAARWVAADRTSLLAARSLLLRATCSRDLLERRRGNLADSIEDALCDVAGAERLLAADSSSPPATRGTSGSSSGPMPDATSGGPLGAQPSVILHRAIGLRIELDSLREPTRGPAALARILAELDGVVDVEAVTDTALLESHGWWCVSGFAIAQRHLRGATLHRTLGILSNKVDEIASRVDSWPLRERVLTLEFERRERLLDDGGSPGAWILDHEDVRTIVGCIGGSRRFRAIGLDILRSATFVDTPTLPAIVRRRIVPAR